ncbi:MOSC domain-containing protein [Blastococcus sp. PRF04-17]|uniref:MOSC domain-containing protein n=1 Tax=Blastococcus sp. PRF04-17 TaxID=2933797 RepID=UPI001FF6B7E9|nr:MOSC N-terminal beta barrel domain-containing protein [Blastococcus sp. PRF04-17]UOY00520.1 MOSC N-terminal beta barrel domain-containing protein [Blastococcus sp. PRF04-17]
MRVLELWRYPVKSLQGERLAEAELGPEGVTGDRQWALFDVDTGYGLTARRVPELLFATARLRPGGGDVDVVLPDGTVTGDDDRISAWLGRRVTLRPAGDPFVRPRYESPDDDLAEAAGATARWHDWQGAAGAFHDNADGRVSLVTTGSLGDWDRRRFRANVVLDGGSDADLVGRRVRLGEAVLDVNVPIPRCVMVTRPQPGGIGRDTSVLKTIHRERDGELAVAALVREAGTVRTGDVLEPV